MVDLMYRSDATEPDMGQELERTRKQLLLRLQNCQTPLILTLAIFMLDLTGSAFPSLCGSIWVASRSSSNIIARADVLLKVGGRLLGWLD